MSFTVTIHQIEHLVWLGLLDKISKADLLVLGDTLQFKKNYFENRNQIRTLTGKQYITVPVESDNHKEIREVRIINKTDWQKKYLGTIKQHYSKAPFFKYYYPQLEEIINNPQTEYISDLNFQLLIWMLKIFEIKTPIIMLSDLDVDSNLKSSELLYTICKKIGATTYLSGHSGQDYLDLSIFKDIKVKFHEFFHPAYKQQYLSFIPGLSAIDVIFNYGDNSSKLLCNKGAEAMSLSINSELTENSNVLEMFGGDGSGHLQSYAHLVKNLSIWEMNVSNWNKLNEQFPNAEITCCDSLIEAEEHLKEFDLIVVDAPAKLDNKIVLPKALKMLKDNGTVIFRAIKTSYNNCIEVNADATLNEWEEIINTEFIILEKREQIREFYFFEHWLSNYVFKLQRRIL